MKIRMLVVDDEPLAVHYLADALMHAPDPAIELELEKAFSAREAIALFETRPFDLLLSDIRMPGMNGMELADVVRERWPRCRIIFLTGHNDFEYVQSAMRKGGVDYVLKTEGDDAIMRAIRKAVAGIEDERGEERILQNARQQYLVALPSIRRDYLIDILNGESGSQDARRQWFDKLDIDLDPDQPMLVGLCRIDRWGAFAAPEDRTLLFFSIHNIVEEVFREQVRFVSFPYDRSRVIWLVQPFERQSGDEADEAFGRCAERVREGCGSLLKVTLSIALSAKPTPWESLGNRIEALKLLLAFRLGDGESKIVTDTAPAGDAADSRKSSRVMAEINRLRRAALKLDLLESQMDNGEEEAFATLYRELFAWDPSPLSEEEGKWLGLELYSHLSAFYLTYLNRRDLPGTIGDTIAMEKITNPDSHGSLPDMIRYFGELGAQLAGYNKRHRAAVSEDIVSRVNQYVQQYLHEELSLTKLAEIVYLSPPYLSRIYKLMTGKGLLEYINEARINKAKLLLKTTDKKVHEIAAEVGLESAPYFTRLFRKKIGHTPQEYRESRRSLR